MLVQQKLVISLALFAALSSAGPLVYIVGAGDTGAGQFGTVDLTSGAFTQIGPTEPDGYFGLVAGPNGSYLSLTYAGNLDSIDPTTGNFTNVGATGLTNCVSPQNPTCGPTSAFSIGAAAGKVYATDFNNDLYIVNPQTGAATLLSSNTGLPASPFVLGTQNADGTLNFADEAIWGSGGSLYITYDALTFDPVTLQAVSTIVAPELYRVDPVTGIATAIGPTDLGIGGATDVNGVSYEFNDLTGQIATIDLSTGVTSPIGFFDQSAGVIQGVAVTPEPASLMLTGLWRAGDGDLYKVIVGSSPYEMDSRKGASPDRQVHHLIMDRPALVHSLCPVIRTAPRARNKPEHLVARVGEEPDSTAPGRGKPWRMSTVTPPFPMRLPAGGGPSRTRPTVPEPLEKMTAERSVALNERHRRKQTSEAVIWSNDR